MRQRLLALLAALVLAAALVVARRWGPAPGEDAPQERWLVRLEPPASPAELLGDGRLTKRRALRAHVPSTLSWTLRVPPAARLETHLAFARRTQEELVGVTCAVRVEIRPEDGTTRVLVERAVEPHLGWEPYRADLSDWADEEAVLSLDVDCASRPGKRTWSDAVRWSVPVVSGRRPPGLPNVLLVTIDTLRADHLGAYGYERETSPQMDALARRGLLFRNAETVQSATWPALTTLHTSLYPSAHGVVWNGHELPGGVPTLAELLHSRGYSTSAFVTNMKRARHRGFARLSASTAGEQAADDREAALAAIEQMREDRDRPFFVWVHLISPHADYAPPPPWDRAFTAAGEGSVSGSIEELVRRRLEGRPLSRTERAHVVGLYDGEVAFVDELVGRLLGALASLGLEGSTLVVLTSDHGEDLYEHNDYPFHSPSMYASSLRVPLIVAFPGVLPEGEATDHPASLVDLAPTILGLVELPVPSSFQGTNLLPGRALPAESARTQLFSETNGRIHGLSAGGFRLVLNPGGETPGAPGGAYPIAAEELYDTAEDPGERRNLAPHRPELVASLSAQIAEWKARRLRGELPPQTIDPETLEDLRALGYVVD